MAVRPDDERAAVQYPLVSRSIASCLLACVAFAAVADESPGAMARFYSESSVEGLRLGMARSETASEDTKRCVRDIAPDALAAAYQAFLAKAYAAEDIAAFDAFIASPLGLKLQAYSHARFLASHAVEGAEEATLSDEDQQALRAWGETEVGRKFVELYTNQHDAPELPHIVEMKRLLEGCQPPG